MPRLPAPRIDSWLSRRENPSMLRTIAERWLRKRFTFPVLVIVAAGLLVLSEVTYFQTSATLRGGIGWSEARMATARLQQLMTDVESASRGFLLTGHVDDLAPYQTALAELPGARQAVADHLERLGPAGHETGRRLALVTSEALAETAEALALAQSGRRDAAIALLETGQSREKMAALRYTLGEQLQQTAKSQVASRVTIFDSLMVNRLGVGALAVLSVLGLFVYMGQLHLQDQERNQQQAALARERVRLEDEVRRRTADLRELTQHLQTAREDERAHLARELHDELGGLLTAIKLDLARLRNKLTDRDDLKERLDHMNRSLNEGIAFKRRIIEDLRPSALANLGLKVSLEALCKDMAERLDVPVDAQLTDVSLSPQADLAIYRFVQEALTNIGKHAEATSVRVTLGPSGDRAVVEVRDDGAGFDTTLPRPGHHGLTGMRFRAETMGGRVTVTSAPGRGTLLRAEFPRKVSDEERAA
ncbi:histidine kinase [Piscinibacter gummiphilus]|nr:histidine kinase [Piscinibacter gummiphilus]